MMDAPVEDGAWGEGEEEEDFTEDKDKGKVVKFPTIH